MQMGNSYVRLNERGDKAIAVYEKSKELLTKAGSQFAKFGNKKVTNCT